MLILVYNFKNYRGIKMKFNKLLIKSHSEVILMSFLYPSALIAMDQLTIIQTDYYTYDGLNFMYRFVFSLLIGLAFGAFSYQSKEILKYKSVRIHIIVWLVIFTLITIFTPLAWLRIVEMPQVLLDIMFNLKLVYLGEQLIILAGFYICLLGYYYLNKKVND